jgi:periplasmic protein TonB
MRTLWSKVSERMNKHFRVSGSTFLKLEELGVRASAVLRRAGLPQFNISGRDPLLETSSNRSPDPDKATILASLKEIVAARDQRLDSILGAIAEAARRWTGASGAAIAMWKDGAMVCRARSGETAPPLGAQLSADTGISGECLRSGKMQHCADTENDPLVDAEVCRSLGLRSIAVLPVQGWRGINGILEVFSTEPATFTERHLAFLQQLSALAERARAAQPYGATPASKARVEEPQTVGLLPASDRVRDVAAVFLGRRARPFVLGGVGMLAILLGIVIWLGWRGPAEASQKTKVPQPAVSTVVPARPPDNDPVWRSNPGGESLFPSKASAGIPVKLASKVDVIPQPKTQPDRPPLATDATAEAAFPHDTPAEPAVETLTVEPPPVPVGGSNTASLQGVLAPPPAVPELSPPAVSQGISGGRLVRRVSPTYPAQALLQGLQGKVILDAVIFEDGTVHDLKVAEGHPVLARSAMEAVQRWRYQPYELNGQPVKTQTRITIDFKLP